LHSGRRPLIYGIASAATCAPPGCGSRQPPFVHAPPSENRHREGVRGSARRAPSGRNGFGSGSSQVVSTGNLEETE
jgi:hypothetical protein